METGSSQNLQGITPIGGRTPGGVLATRHQGGANSGLPAGARAVVSRSSGCTYSSGIAPCSPDLWTHHTRRGATGRAS